MSIERRYREPDCMRCHGSGIVPIVASGRRGRTRGHVICSCGAGQLTGSDSWGRTSIPGSSEWLRPVL